MKEFSFGLAKPEDDAAIQKLLRDNPVPGNISISYERAPSYLAGCSLLGGETQTLIARHLPSGNLAALASRSIRQHYVNGEVKSLGYLGQLRVDHRFRSRWLVSEGFRSLRKLHEDQFTDGYITTIIDDNHEAKGVLVHRARYHFPTYRDIGKLNTLAISPKPLKANSVAGLNVRKAGGRDLSAIVAMLQSHGSQKQFFPFLSEEDLQPGSLLTRDLAITDFVVAERSGNLCGVVALWDQSKFKQPVIRGYSHSFNRKRFLYNMYARLRGMQPLPPLGEMVPLAYAAFACVIDNDPVTYKQLLRKLSSIAHAKGYSRVMVGHTEQDPLLTVARKFNHLNYTSRIYTVCWKEECSFHEQLDGRTSHIEIATL